MIKKFGFKNFASFLEGSEISFEFDGKTPEDVSFGMSIGTVLGIKGANGSGKTNILKALTFLLMFTANKSRVNTINQRRDKNTIEIPIETFFSSNNVSEFYIEFIVENITYQYELDIKPSGIQREVLTKKLKRESTVFVREKNQLVKNLNSLNEIKMIKLSSDQSILSLVDSFSFNKDMTDLKKVNQTFKKMISNVNSYGIKAVNDLDIFTFSESYKNDPQALDFMLSILKKADNGISNVKIEEARTETGEVFYYPIFFHNHAGEEQKITFSSESKGSNIIYSIMLKYHYILKNGGLLIHDEFDTHLHAMVLPHIINLFLNKKTNPHNAQLLITAHNTEIIDSLGRYRTILVNKEDNESYCYRLDELSMLRNDRPITPFYLSGKIGGVPQHEIDSRDEE